TVTGLGGTGVELMLAVSAGATLQGHPMIPMLQVSGDRAVAKSGVGDLDLILAGDAKQGVADLLSLVQSTLSRTYVPNAAANGNVRFQLTRGDLGVSL